MTDIVVLKFGGSSVANLERLQDVARLVISRGTLAFGSLSSSRPAPK